MDRPTLTVGDIFRRYGDAYRHGAGRALATAQRRVMSAIESCRTAALGGHVEQCDDWMSLALRHLVGRDTRRRQPALVRRPFGARRIRAKPEIGGAIHRREFGLRVTTVAPEVPRLTPASVLRAAGVSGAKP